MIYHIKPCPAPRMTQADRWKKRPCVLRYFAFKDDVRRLDIQLPDDYEKVIFWLEMPQSWSKKRKTEFAGKPHRNKPDTDNLWKALTDALHKDDSHIWRINAEKRWSEKSAIQII